MADDSRRPAPSLRRVFLLVVVLAFVTTASLTVTAEDRDSPPPVRQGIFFVLPAPQPADAVPTTCLASADSPLCRAARQLAEKPPCTRAEGCRALDAWRELAGEPSLRLAPFEAPTPDAERGTAPDASGAVGTLLRFPSPDAPRLLDGVSPAEPRVLDAEGAARDLEAGGSPPDPR